MDLIGFVLHCHGTDLFLTRGLFQSSATEIIIMQITINHSTEHSKNWVHIIIPVESPWHHVVMNKLPFPPKVH